MLAADLLERTHAPLVEDGRLEASSEGAVSEVTLLQEQLAQLLDEVALHKKHVHQLERDNKRLQARGVVLADTRLLCLLAGRR